MGRQLIYKKGYLLKIVSWENDADNYKTIDVLVDNKEKALAFMAFCLGPLHRDNTHTEKGIGNTHEYDLDETITEKLKVFIESNPYWKELYKDSSDEDIYEKFSELAYDLVGGSDFYKFRVCESCKLYEVKEDVYLETIEVE